MRNLLIVLSILLLPLTTARADVSVGVGVGINVPGASIGIQMSNYPRLVPIPGYPVYYDPYIALNFFFYDGMYWVLQGDSWYVSSWYNGPWQLVAPMYVPAYILRIPVRYYRRPPAYFRGWHRNEAPRWGEHWGRDWEQQRKGWNQWDRRSTPHYAPLPSYQRHYSGKRYPREMERQRSIESRQYRYQPRSSETQRFYQQQRRQSDQRRRDEGRGHDRR
jgi:hypothetical protein